ncbi:MAG: hypothetical protein II970_05880 [Paludibacteraceae bacterium]|nr:hypothetical protein [Paludibacteraceae bacterium]
MHSSSFLFPLLMLAMLTAPVSGQKPQAAQAQKPQMTQAQPQALSPETLALFTGDYVGNMLIGSDFTQKQVRVTLSANGDVTLHKVRFARMMPVKVTAVIPNLPITAATGSSGRQVLKVSCDSVIPRVGNTEFPSRMATEVSGTSDGRTMAFSALFGGKPLTFTGTRTIIN